MCEVGTLSAKECLCHWSFAARSSCVHHLKYVNTHIFLSINLALLFFFPNINEIMDRSTDKASSQLPEDKENSDTPSSLFFRARGSAKPRTGEDVVKSLRWVIFPDNKHIKRWDLVVLGALFLYVFILPYQIGVSGGIPLLFNIPWLVFNILLNSVFFVDTFLYFNRAFYTSNGHLVLDLKQIRRHYLRTFFIPNFLSVLPYTIGFYLLGRAYIDSDGDPSPQVESFLAFVQVASLLKLIRLVRVRTILSSSDAVTSFRQKRNAQVLELWKYVSLIVVVSHYFACIWSLVAYIQAKSLDEEALTSTPNWIGYWYEGNAVDGGLHPLGWDHAIDRYVLSLFWAIQTITSIGYGNIVPVTRAEYFLSCGLQLGAGVMWAYVIGGLVGVAAGMQVRAESYRTRISQANDMIHEFADPDEIIQDDDVAVANIESKQVAKRIRKYIHNQYKRSMAESCSNSITGEFPVFDTLTPELQRDSSVLLINQYLKAVPYLSLEYMSQEDQSTVALQSVALEFCSGETIWTENAVPGLGRGIFIFRGGSAFNLDRSTHMDFSKDFEKMSLVTAGMSYGADKVLVEDDNPLAKGRLQFLTFSQVLFIPREAVLSAFKRSDKAWKNCARWIYLRTLLLAKIEEEREQSGSD